MHAKSQAEFEGNKIKQDKNVFQIHTEHWSIETEKASSKGLHLGTMMICDAQLIMI